MSIINNMKNEMVDAALEQFMPSIMEHSSKVNDALEKIFDTNEKICVIRRINNDVKILLFDTSKGELIVNVSKDKNIFKADNDSLIKSISLNELIKSIVNGKLNEFVAKIL